jgi:hypothetical protein
MLHCPQWYWAQAPQQACPGAGWTQPQPAGSQEHCGPAAAAAANFMGREGTPPYVKKHLLLCPHNINKMPVESGAERGGINNKCFLCYLICLKFLEMHQ